MTKRSDQLKEVPFLAAQFLRVDTYASERLVRLLRQRKGRHVRAGEAAGWIRDYFHALGLHRLQGTIHYPGAA